MCIEKIGPIQENAQNAWQELHKVRVKLSENNQITGGMSLYKTNPPSYRAGHSIAAAPKNLPDGMTYIQHNGGKYASFAVTGSYSQLPQATGKVFELVKTLGIQQRDDFYIEDYANDPATTPESELITHILIPTV
ncbi:MAG: GyrI-like domain-containing protein [Bdellovibrionaceae bacterium]|nr:GyrI-like domain-containing protein [Pseudobdellovibrionaceae bacterium]